MRTVAVVERVAVHVRRRLEAAETLQAVVGATATPATAKTTAVIT
jgi:hypothetical protein